MTNEPDSTNGYGNEPQLPTESNSRSELPKKHNYYHLDNNSRYMKSAKMQRLKRKFASRKSKDVRIYLEQKG